MKSTLLLVADGHAARFFSADTPSSDLQEFETLSHPASRLHEKELVTDMPGRENRGNSGGHALQTQTPAKKHELINFSKQIARRIDKLNCKHELKNLVIVSAPEFLGMIRSELSSTASKLVRFELNKNLTRKNIRDIRSHLPKNLASSHL